MSSKINLGDLPTNLIAFIYQYLSTKDMYSSSLACQKCNKALHQDYIFLELAKRNVLFSPAEAEKANSYKEYFIYLKQLKENREKGNPNIGYKMVPYRGHKFPIEVLTAFNYKHEINSLIVSGDSSGEVATWNVDEDGDKEKDVIFKGNSKIIGIKNLNEDSNMFVWTEKNIFYYYDVNMYKKTEKNSERFKLVKTVSLGEQDNPIKQIYYDQKNEIIYMSPDININNIPKKQNIYALNLKNFTIDKFVYSYNYLQTNAVLNNNQNLFQNIIPMYQPFQSINNTIDKESTKKNINYFVVNEDKIFLYINIEPVKNKLISIYNNKDILPNVFIFKKNTRIAEGHHIDLDYIYNILLISNKEVAFMGHNNKSNKIIMMIYNTSFFNQLREVELYNQKPDSFDLLYFNNQELYYLINRKILKKVQNVYVNQLKVDFLGNLKDVPSINCIEADELRIILASDELFMSIFDIKTGKLWFNFLGGSKTVVPKSFVKHPQYEGFHYLKLTRDSIISVIGNLIREYKFTFKYEKKKE